APQERGIPASLRPRSKGAGRLLEAFPAEKGLSWLKKKPAAAFHDNLPLKCPLYCRQKCGLVEGFAQDFGTPKQSSDRQQVNLAVQQAPAHRDDLDLWKLGA